MSSSKFFDTSLLWVQSCVDKWFVSCRKFLELGTPEQKETLNGIIIKNVIALSLQMYGCRVVQKALEVMTYGQQKDIVQHLDGNVVKLIKDQNGNHVIQKAVESVPSDLIGFIPRSFSGQVKYQFFALCSLSSTDKTGKHDKSNVSVYDNWNYCSMVGG